MNKNEKMRHSERKRIEMDVKWPDPPFNIVLVEPSIPPNTGNIARLCAATGAILHLIEPFGFELSARQVRRAGLDYWDSVNLNVYPDIDDFFEKNQEGRKWFFSTAGSKNFQDVEYQPGDYFIFGNEAVGLPDELLEKNADHVCNIPIRLDCVRSLNLSNCAAIVIYDALRKINT